MLIGDPGRLRQVFVNLIGNAIKFTQEGEVVVKGETIHTFEQKAVFRFTIKDTGLGIPLEKQERIFESFSQADGSTTRKFGGTGLGITIANMLVEKMGGRIGLQSDPGRGTRFWFELEFSRQPDTSDPSQIPETDFKDLMVFIIDDAKSNRDILSRYLASWGCRSITSATGEDALVTLKKFSDQKRQIDVILIDYSLPGINEFRLPEKIRSIPAYGKTPLIVLAALGKLGDGIECKKIGVDGYLTKPVRQQELKAFINYVLGNAATPHLSSKKLVTRHTLAEERRKNVRILLVEDYLTNQQLAVKQLESAGFHVSLANDGKQAVQLYETQSFDVILMDIQMPVMDGYEATRAIRKIESGKKRVPIIAMTAHAIKGYREKCLDAGMDDYITKPLTREILISTVSRWIQGTGEVSGTYNYYLPQDKQTCLDDIILYDQALEEFQGDEAFFLEVLDGFLDTVKSQLVLLDSAVKARDGKEVQIQSHSIKGGGGKS